MLVFTLTYHFAIIISRSDNMKKMVNISPITNELLVARAKQMGITQSKVVETALDIYLRIIDGELALAVHLVDKDNKKE